MPSFKNKSRTMGSGGELQPTLSSKPFKSLEANEQAAPLGSRSSCCTDSVLWRPEGGVPSDLTHTVCLLWLGVQLGLTWRSVGSPATHLPATEAAVVLSTSTSNSKWLYCGILSSTAADWP